MPDILTSIGHLSPAGYLTVVIAVSVLCQWVAWRIGVPSILLLLITGFGIGQVVDAESVFGHDVLFDGIRITVGIILFEGSLSLRIKQIRDLRRPVARLISVTVLIAWVLIAASAYLLGFHPEVALLIGALLVVTGPTVIAPLLRALRPTQRISSLLRWEGVIVDPIGTVLALLVFQAVTASQTGLAVVAVATALVKTVVVAGVLGIALGAGLEVLLRRRAVPDFLHGVLFLAAAIGALVVSDALQPESGLLTVTILGVYLGNRPHLDIEHVAEFKEHLQVLFVGALFIVLGGRVSPAELGQVAPKALILLAALVIVVRPVSVLIGLAGTRVTRAERTMMACMAPRGVVAAAVTSIFALSIGRSADTLARQASHASGATARGLAANARHLHQLAGQAQSMVPLVFIVIVGTVTIYGLSSGRIASRLGLAAPNPQGVMFVGVNRWVVQTAGHLRDAGVPVLIVARNHATLAPARSAGLETRTANILSEYAVKDMDLAGLGSFVACTPEDETNATAARQFARTFGAAHTYQLHRDSRSTGTGDDSQDTATHLSGRYAFVPSLSRDAMDTRVRDGAKVRRFDLSAAFTLTDLRAEYDDPVLLFVLRSPGHAQVVDHRTRIPEDSGSVLALVGVRHPHAAGESPSRSEPSQRSGERPVAPR